MQRCGHETGNLPTKTFNLSGLNGGSYEIWKTDFVGVSQTSITRIGMNPDCSTINRLSGRETLLDDVPIDVGIRWVPSFHGKKTTAAEMPPPVRRTTAYAAVSPLLLPARSSSIGMRRRCLEVSGASMVISRIPFLKFALAVSVFTPSGKGISRRKCP